jgi:hypothetical protein
VKQQPSRPPGTKQVLFPFPKEQSRQTTMLHDTRTLVEQCHRPFLPLGLFVWGAQAETYVNAIRVGNQHEGALQSSPVPARYFSEGRSMAELQKLADAGELAISVEQRRVLEMAVGEVGNTLSVEIRGPFEDACLWGLTYEGQWPRLTQRIVPVEYNSDPAHADRQGPITVPSHHGFHGQVVEHHLGGDRVISNVYAPSEESVCRLLVAARRPERMF